MYSEHLPKPDLQVGLAVTNEGHILVVRRGKAQLDVFDARNGAFLQTLGPDVDTLWSDLEVDLEGHAYVVDYLSATVRALKYRAL